MYYKQNMVLRIFLIATLILVQSTITDAITVDVIPQNNQVVPPGDATYTVIIADVSTEEILNLNLIDNPLKNWHYSYSENDFTVYPGDRKEVLLTISVPGGTANGEYFHDVIAQGIYYDDAGQLIVDELGSYREYLNVETIAIPEFATIAMPVISVLGMMFIMQRRRSRKF